MFVVCDVLLWINVCVLGLAVFIMIGCYLMLLDCVCVILLYFNV